MKKLYYLLMAIGLLLLIAGAIFTFAGVKLLWALSAIFIVVGGIILYEGFFRYRLAKGHFLQKDLRARYLSKKTVH